MDYKNKKKNKMSVEALLKEFKEGNLSEADVIPKLKEELGGGTKLIEKSKITGEWGTLVFRNQFFCKACGTLVRAGRPNSNVHMLCWSCSEDRHY